MNWRGGKSAHPAGYVTITAGIGPKPKLEHIAIVERAIGKPLRSGAQVHHVDGNKRNNDPSNLVACDSQAYHQLLHKRQRALDACGDPNAHRCVFCGGYDRQDEMTVLFVRARRRVTERAYHRTCNTLYVREFRARHIAEAS